MRNIIGLVAMGAALAGCVAAPEVKCGYLNKPAEGACGASPCADSDGFVSLFNGKDLTGWIGATAMYGVDPNEPGILQCFPERHRKGMSGNLCTAGRYRNFVLRFEFCMPTNGNNGLGLRMTAGVSDAEFTRMHGMTLRQAFGAKLDGPIRGGLLIWRGDALCLTRRGMDLQNQVLVELL